MLYAYHGTTGGDTLCLCRHYNSRDTEAVRGLPGPGVKPGPDVPETAQKATQTASRWGKLISRFPLARFISGFADNADGSNKFAGDEPKNAQPTWKISGFAMNRVRTTRPAASHIAKMETCKELTFRIREKPGYWQDTSGPNALQNLTYNAN